MHTSNLIEVSTPLSDFDYIAKYQTQKCKDELKSFKARQANYFLAGNLKVLKRNDNNLLTRSLITIDYENTGLDYSALVQKVSSALKGYRFIIYPTIGDGIKEVQGGTRARVIVDISRNINKNEYVTVKKSITDLIKVPVTDGTNNTWSQLSGLPVATKANQVNETVVNGTGKPFKVVVSKKPAVSNSNDLEPTDQVRTLLDRNESSRTELEEMELSKVQVLDKEALTFISNFERTHHDYLADENNFKNVLIFLVASWKAKEITYNVLKSAMFILASGNKKWEHDNLVDLQAHITGKYTNRISFKAYFGNQDTNLSKQTEYLGSLSENDLIHDMLDEKRELVRYIMSLSEEKRQKPKPLKFYQVGRILSEYLPIFITEKSNKSFVYVYDFSRGIYTTEEYFIERWARLLEPRLKKNDINEIFSELRTSALVAEPMKSKKLIAMKNGFYDVEKKKLFDYSPKYFFITQIATKYVPNAPEPEIDGWKPSQLIKQLSNNDNQVEKLLWQVISASLNGNYSRGKAIFLVGNQTSKMANGSNGKGTFQDLLRYIVGNENTANLKIDQFSGRFVMNELVGKTLDIGDDVSVGKYIKDQSNFNSAVTGEELRAEPKGKDPQHYRFYGLIVQSTNEMPKFGNKTNGSYRRIIIVPFNAQFMGKANNRKIKDDYIKRPEVREYFVAKALNVVFDNFTVPDVSGKMLNDFEVENDPIQGFTKDVLMYSPQAECPTRMLYELYVGWCTENGFHNPVSNPKLTQSLKQLFNTSRNPIEKLTASQWKELLGYKHEYRYEFIEKNMPINKLVCEYKNIRPSGIYVNCDLYNIPNNGYDTKVVKAFVFPLRQKTIDALHLYDDLPSKKSPLYQGKKRQLQELLNEIIE